MKIVHVGAISTGIVILLGIVMVIPPFIQPSPPLKVAFAFSAIDENNALNWCRDLSQVLEKYDIKATVFVTGRIADLHPNCVRGFSDNIDIGSQTYHYVSLTTINDYEAQLDEIKQGKEAVDRAGKLSSKVFRAPYGTTDENIYSLLRSSGILADFSYEYQYNKYYQGDFIKFDLNEYDGNEHDTDFFRSLPVTNPILITFDDSTPVEKIDDFISKLKSRHIVFVNASELTGIELTIRQGVKN
ncbi:MAG TPA: polysaccharide deacetylase family protein [Nitrosopumilaceae archaeon]|nr:polysaccharide deacetylase family protein [Nitrosopumilaceae archaeon]